MEIRSHRIFHRTGRHDRQARYSGLPEM